jgi:hypothetical protein
MSSLKLISWSIVSHTFLYACACDVFALNADLPWLAKRIRDASTKKTGSCVNDSGGNACLNPGGDGMGIITVYPGSCKGDTACEDLPSGDVIYGTSCIGSDACDQLGEESTGKVEVGPNSCNGKNACEDLGYIAVGDVIVGASSCVGVDACYSLGDASLTNVIVGSGSCMGEEACFFLGDSGDALLTLTVGDGSCNGVDACNELGWDADYLTDITIQDRACVGVEACYYALLDFSFTCEDDSITQAVFEAGGCASTKACIECLKSECASDYDDDNPLTKQKITINGACATSSTIIT